MSCFLKIPGHEKLFRAAGLDVIFRAPGRPEYGFEQTIKLLNFWIYNFFTPVYTMHKNLKLELNIACNKCVVNVC